MKKHSAYTLTGLLVASCSAILVLDVARAKQKSKCSRASALLIGLAGIALGASIAYQPQRKANQKLADERLLAESDVARMEQNIAEVLSGRAEEI